jgi:hypothetical protein
MEFLSFTPGMQVRIFGQNSWWRHYQLFHATRQGVPHFFPWSCEICKHDVRVRLENLLSSLPSRSNTRIR